MPPFTKGPSSWSIDIENLPQLRGAFRAIAGFEDLPYAREAMGRIQGMAVGATQQRVPRPSFRVVGMPIKGEGLRMMAPIKVIHPAAKSFEFGRHFYYEGFTRAAFIGPTKGKRAARAAAKGYMKRTGTRVWRTGMKEQPFIGIKSGGHAIGAIAPKAAEIMSEALAKEWKRLADE